MRNILLLALSLGLVAGLAGCLNDGDDNASGTAGEDPDATDQMDRDAQDETTAGDADDARAAERGV